MDPESSDLIIRIANKNDQKYTLSIINEMESSARIRGTGIAKRTPEYINEKMEKSNAVIAVTSKGEWVGFSYCPHRKNIQYYNRYGYYETEYKAWV